MRRLGWLLVVAMVGGCGKAKEGDACNNPQCEDTKTAFYCENGSFRSIPCRGPQGCKASSDTQVWIVCDITNAQVGDNCPDIERASVICQTPSSALYCTGVT